VSVQLEEVDGQCDEHPGMALMVYAHITVDSQTTVVGPICLKCQGLHTKLMDCPVDDQRARRRVSARQERRVMSDLGGRVQPASGALPGHKGDGRVLFRHRLEMKYTTRRSYTLTRQTLDKIRGECWGPERPALILEFKNNQGVTEDSWAVVPYQDWLGHVQDDDQADDHRRPATKR
jgi:hypothetical protein